MLMKNTKELENVLSDVLKQGLDCASKKIKKIIDEYLGLWYDDLEPYVYKRTNTFLKSCVVSELKQKNRSYFIDIYIDTNKLKTGYSISKSDVMDILHNADKGIHGTTPEWMRSGKTEVGFWSDAINEINRDKYEVILAGFIKYAKSKGLTVHVK